MVREARRLVGREVPDGRRRMPDGSHRELAGPRSGLPERRPEGTFDSVTSSPPRGTDHPLPVPLAVGLLFAALAASSLLRAFHAATPRLFPGPAGSVLGVAVLFFAAVHLRARRRGADRLAPPGDSTARLTIGKLTPLLLLLFTEKWITVTLLDHAYDWIGARLTDPRAADAVYRLWTALALAGVALAGVVLLRQVATRIARLLQPERVRFALITLAAAGAASAAALGSLAAVSGASRWSGPVAGGGLLLLIGGAQLVRGAVEEFYYRGLIQTAMVRLLAEAGLGEGRLARTLAIAAVALGFTIEHVDPAAPWRRALPGLLFVLAMGALLGLLLETSRNLYLVMLTHGAVNAVIVGLVPLPLAGDGGPLVSPGAVVMLLMVLAFFGVVLSHRRRGFA